MADSFSGRASVVVVGGGYGGIRVAKDLDDLAEVTLVDPKESFVHNVAGWRALVEPSWLVKIFFSYDHLLKSGRFVRDRATKVDGTIVTLGFGEEIRGDYVVLATGSYYPFPAKLEIADSTEARDRVAAAHAELNAAASVLVVGAGPSGLELAGEIKSFFPEKQVTVADISPDILNGPFDPELRVELRRQLEALGVELVLGEPLSGLNTVGPATRGPVEVQVGADRTLRADIWFRAFGVTPHGDYLSGALAGARDERGYLRVEETMRVVGQERVFALGDLSDADRDMAGIASRQAEVVVANVRALINGEPPASTYTRMPPGILVPLGPAGGAGQLPGVGLVGAETTADYKGRDLMVDHFGALFDA
jgi:NADH dehydrogenase FAD-containing subunit